MTRNECEAIRPLISAALDGELDEQEFVRLSEHLASCSQCRQVHRDYYHLRDRMRAADAPDPPPALSQTIRKETVEKPPPSPIVRFISRAGLRFGMSTAAATIVILIVASFFAYQGHQQMTNPGIAGSEPVQESGHVWPVHEPVMIHFNKPMNQESVEQNLVIHPFSERERLPTSWDGNTLMIGRSSDRSVTLRADTDYIIWLLAYAEDAHGNPIGETWTLSFRTGPRDVAVATPSPDRDTPEQNLEEDQEPERNTPSSTEQPPTQEPSPAGDSPAGESETQDDAVDDSSGGSAGTDGRDEEQSDESETAPTEQSNVTDPTSTAEPEPSETPEPAPSPTSTPDPSPTPEPDETETPTPTAEPTAPPSPEPIAVSGAFGEVYWGNSEIEERLGEPAQPEHVVLASEQEFQRGVMFRFVNTSGLSIYVFKNDGSVLNFPATWTSEDGEFSGETPSDDLFVPQQHFGKVWAGNKETVAVEIGFALSAEPVPNFESRVQQFDNGHMIYSRGMVYVVFGDDTWQRFIDGNSSGFQSEDSLGSGGEQESTPPPEDDAETTTEPQPTDEGSLQDESTPPPD